jgi:hypothetical protein
MKTPIEMAKEAGFMLRAESVKGQSDWWECFDEAIEKLVASVRADEREAAQAEHEADKVIIQYHEATIKRLEAAPVHGCDFCNHPLYAGTKCKSCGREVTSKGLARILHDRVSELLTEQPAPVPLTQQQVVDGFCKTLHQTQYVAVFDAGVRFAENQHGITKGQP